MTDPKPPGNDAANPAPAPGAPAAPGQMVPGAVLGAPSVPAGNANAPGGPPAPGTPAPPAGAAPGAPGAQGKPSAAPVPPPEERTRMLKVSEREKKYRARRLVPAELVVKRPGVPEAHLELVKPRTVIGRDRDACDVVLEDEDVSRQHASVTREHSGFFVLHDLGSRNGVKVSGRLVNRRTLVTGDVFTVGGTEFIFKSLPEPTKK